MRRLLHRVSGTLTRSRDGSLRRNSLWLMSTTIVNSALGYGYWLIIARMFTPAKVGLAAGLIALMTLTSLASNLGTASALVQRLPARRTLDEWSTTLSASLLGGAAFGVVAALIVVLGLHEISPTLSSTRQGLVVGLLFVAGSAFWTVGTVLDYAFIAVRRSRDTTSRNALFGVTKIPLVLLLPAMLGAHAAVTTILASWVLACIFSCALAVRLMIPRLRPGARLRLGGTWAELKAMTRMLAGNYFITLGNVLPAYLLPVIVVSRLSAAENAYFYITWLVGGVFFMISSSIASSLFAEGSNAPTALYRLSVSSARMTATLLAPAMLLMFLAGRFILTMFGAHYADAGIALLLILTAAAVPDGITNIYVAVLRVEGRLRVAASLTCGMALMAVLGGWALAPSYGLAGIGVVWLASQTIGSVWVAWDRVGSPHAQRRRQGFLKRVSVGG